MLKPSRLFVGNIPEGTTDAELKNEFGNYGVVESVDLKVKVNNFSDNETNVFAFINIKIEDHMVEQCIREFQQHKFNGVFLTVNRAKESFLERLKREREEAAQLEGNQAPQSSSTFSKNTSSAVEEKVSLPTLPTLASKDEDDEESESESSSSEDEGPAVPSYQRPSTKVKDEDEIVRKWNNETYIEKGKLKIIPITGQVKEIIEINKKVVKPKKEFDAKSKLADEKRMESLNKMKDAYEQQKLAIKSALSQIDSRQNQKIVFDHDGEEMSEEKRKLKSAKENKSKKPKLFDENDEGESNYTKDFAVKEQFQGAAGQKLFELQSKFKNDSRFQMSKQFLDEIAENEEIRKERKKIRKDLKNWNEDGDDERRQQLEILASVIGREIKDKKQIEKEKIHKTMLRFDPTKKEHSKYIVNSKNKNDKMDVDEEEIPNDEVNIPTDEHKEFKVSEEQHHKVAANFSSMIKTENKSFSILSMLGRRVDIQEDKAETQNQDKILNAISNSGQVRFKYDSSDSEDEITEDVEEKKSSKKAATVANAGGKTTKSGVFRQNFFIFPGDKRLEEGAKFFISKLPDDEGEEKEARMAAFNENRYRLKHSVIKKKIQQNMDRIQSRKKFIKKVNSKAMKSN